VTVADAGAELARGGVAGAAAAESLERHAGAAPAGADAVARSGAVTIVRVPGELPRFELYAPHAELALLLSALEADGFARGDDGLWTLFEVRAGLPEVEPPTVDAFLPQNLDLERFSGLSFSKGCYPGQEVVARTQHLGELKRRLFRGRARGGGVPEPATPLRAIDAGRERDGGKVVRAAAAPDGTIELLAVVPVAEAASGALLALGHAGGEAVTLA
jgi:folate-binding protein YgfZ